MLDLGWQELMVVAFVLVLVVGPKDLPKVLRTIAKAVGKARKMANEFQSSLMDMTDQEEIRDIKQALNDAKAGRFDGFDDIKAAADEVKTAGLDAEAVTKATSGTTKPKAKKANSGKTTRGVAKAKPKQKAKA